jgi:hypothetical protein
VIESKKDNGPFSNASVIPSGQLCHLTEEVEDSDDLDMLVSDEMEYVTNDTNEDVLIYFAHLSNHYLRLATISNISTPTFCHPMKYPVIADSGVSHHMFKEKEFFVNMRPASGQVLLGDGKTNTPIQGIGTINGQVVELENVRYIPDLGESIYSLLLHIQGEGQGLESTYDKGLFITFPTFKSKAIIGTTDIYLDIHPFNLSSDITSIINSSSTLENNIPFTSNLNSHHETPTKDKLLPDLWQYYSSVKTKRQLKLDVPAGFRKLPSTQKLIPPKTPPRNSSDSSNLMNTTDTSFIDSFSLQITSDDTTVVTSNCKTPAISVDSSLPLVQHDTVSPLDPEVIPIIRSVDKPSSSLPNTISMTEDYIKTCVGYRCIDTIKRQFSNLYQPTVQFDNTRCSVNSW